MPELRRPVDLSVSLRAVLEARGLKTPEATQRRMTFRALEHSQWSLSRGTLQKSVDESRSSIAQQIESSANQLRDLRQVIAAGKLRPPKAKLNEREVIRPNRSEEAL